MLIDDTIAQNLEMKFFGSDYLSMYGPFVARLTKDANVYLFDDTAVAMAANVSLSKPTSLVSFLPAARLPFPKMWIEWAAESLSRSMKNLGSPNVVHPEALGRLKRVGFYMSMPREHILEFEYVHEISTDFGVVIELAPMKFTYDMTDEFLPEGGVMGRSARVQGEGKMRAAFRKIVDDPAEEAAYSELFERLSWDYHPDFDDALKNFELQSGPVALSKMFRGWLDEVWTQFNFLILPGILLLNTPAVETVAGPSLEKLNKSRARKGKRPLKEHNIVRLKLSRVARARAEAQSAATGRSVIAHAVAGHIKRRVYSGEARLLWWSPHVRGGSGGDVPVPRRTIVTE